MGLPRHSYGWIILLPPEGDRLGTGDSVRPLRGSLEPGASKTGREILCLFLACCIDYTSTHTRVHVDMYAFARPCIHTCAHVHSCIPCISGPRAVPFLPVPSPSPPPNAGHPGSHLQGPRGSQRRTLCLDDLAFYAAGDSLSASLKEGSRSVRM